MGFGFWLRRFALVYLLALISAAIYIAAFAYRARRGCATCPSER